MSKGKALIALSLILVLTLGFGFGVGTQSVEAGPVCTCVLWCPPAQAWVPAMKAGEHDCNFWPTCYQCDLP
jgi:hypothetical protein